MRFLRSDSEIAVDISTNHPSYRDVRRNGTTKTSLDKSKAKLIALIERYFGDTDSTLAEWLLSDAREEIRIRVQPPEMHSWDYTDRMRGIGDLTP